MPLNPQSFPIWINVAVFVVAGVVVWLTGTRLSRYADLISTRTGLGSAFIGVVFLAVATSLPELATTVTASVSNSTSLAVNNITGGITLQVAILAVADRVAGDRALTHFIAKSVLLLEGVMLVILLGIMLTAFAMGSVWSIFGIGIWPVLIFLAYVLSLYVLHQYRGQERWKPTDIDSDSTGGKDTGREEKYKDWSNRKLYFAFAGGAVVILIAGTVIARTGSALANQTGLGGSFIGATLVALATSLPEVSTTVSAARMGAYSMAFSNIFGSNMLLPALLLPADALSRSGSVVSGIGDGAIIATGAGLLATGVYLIGLIEHRNRTLGGFGIDSLVVMVVYIVSVGAQYLVR